MGRGGAFFSGGAETDFGFTTDQAWLVAILRALDGGLDLIKVMTVNASGVPAIRLEARLCIICKRKIGRTVNRDRVIIIKQDQLIKF